MDAGLDWVTVRRAQSVSSQSLTIHNPLTMHPIQVDCSIHLLVDTQVVLSVAAKEKGKRIKTLLWDLHYRWPFKVDLIEFNTDNGKVINAVYHIWLRVPSLCWYHLCIDIKNGNAFVCTRWFKYDRDWFVCKQAALRSSCATLREWSHNLHPSSCSG